MSSRLCLLMLATGILMLTGCSTGPEIDWDRLQEYILVTGKLEEGISCDRELDEIPSFCQRIIVQRLRPIIGLAFDPEEDPSFGIPGAHVTVSDSDSTYLLIDDGDGIYKWPWGRRNFVQSGRWYRLEILLSEGHFIYSEIITPEIWFEEGADTIWIDPDSITAWTTNPWIDEPTAVEGPHFSHTITYRGTPGAFLDLRAPSGWHRWEYSSSPFLCEHLYRKFEQTDSTVVLYTAVVSPTQFRRQFSSVSSEEGRWIADHITRRNMRLLGYDNDDYWPVEVLEELSNVVGAYGIFAADDNGFTCTTVIARKP